MSLPSVHNLPVWARPFTPFLNWWPRVDRASIKADAMAGLTGALVALPQGVAFATIAGMPPEYGLYAGMIPAVIAALFGSSWHLVSGPTTAASIVLFSVLAPHAEPGSAHYVSLALTLTFLVGVIQIVMGLAKLGTLVNFISHSVVTGFTAGAAILIATNQVKHFTGLAIPRGTSFTDTWSIALSHASEINTAIFAVGLATLLLGIAVKHWLPRWPYMIVAMLGGSALAALGAWKGVGLPTVGALPAKLPPLSTPTLDIESIRAVASGVVAVTLLALTEAVSIARALAARSGQHVDGNQEFVGQGLSNLFGSFFSGYIATGSFNRSGVNYAAGARTPIAAMLAGVCLLVLVLFVAPWAVYLPNAAMAGILFLVAWGLIDFAEIAHVLKTSRAESAILIATFASTLFLALEEAIIIGVLMSLSLYLARTSKPQIRVRAPDRNSAKRRFTDAANTLECPQLRFVRVDGSLFFGATAHVRETLAAQDLAHPNQKHVAIIAHGINFIDMAGAHFLAEAARQRHEAGGGLYLVRLKDTVMEQLAESGALKEISGNHLFDSKTEAIQEIHRCLDQTVCRTCTTRIFRECAAVETGHE
jgi:SulP family sulfate permease